MDTTIYRRFPMLRMKRFAALLLALLMAFSLFACGGPVSESTPPAVTSAAPTAAPTFAPTPEPVDEALALLEEAYALGSGQSLSHTATLTGTVTSIDTPWSDRYENISVVIQVGDHADMPILCFRLEGNGAQHLKKGDTITVTGILTNYKGTIEFDEGCRLDAVNGSAAPAPTPTPEPTAKPAPEGQPSVEKDGYYYDPESVVLYLHYYGQLPPNFITKDEARDLGWSGGSVEPYREGAAIGGDRFSNRDKTLPTKSGRTYTECDMYTNGGRARGACRLVFSNDGLYFYTDDHYGSFTELYVTKDGEVKWK